MDLEAEWADAVYYLACSVVVVEMLAADVLLSLHAVATLLQLVVHVEPLLVHAVVVTELLVQTVAIAILADVHLATEPYAEKYGFQKSSAAKFQYVLPSFVVKRSLTPTDAAIFLVNGRYDCYLV